MNVCYRNTFPDKKPLPKVNHLFSALFLLLTIGTGNQLERYFTIKPSRGTKLNNLTVKTSIGKPTDGEGFKLAVEISLLYSSVQSVLSKDEANKLLQDADQTVCISPLSAETQLELLVFASALTPGYVIAQLYNAWRNSFALIVFRQLEAILNMS